MSSFGAKPESKTLSPQDPQWSAIKHSPLILDGLMGSQTSGVINRSRENAENRQQEAFAQGSRAHVQTEK